MARLVDRSRPGGSMARPSGPAVACRRRRRPARRSVRQAPFEDCRKAGDAADDPAVLARRFGEFSTPIRGTLTPVVERPCRPISLRTAMRRLSIRSVLHAFISAAATTLLLGALAGCDHAPSVIKIGVAQPLSGSIGAQGQDMLNGAQLAVDEINAGGGVRIGSARARLEIVSADDKADAEAGKVAAQRLVEADVLVALANLNSGVSIAAAPIYAQANIPQLAISTKPSYTQLQLATTLRLVANDDLQSRAIGSFAAQLPGAERFAVIDDATPYGKGLADAVAADVARAGKKVPLRLSLDNSRIDFTPQMAELRDTSSDVIVAILSDFQV